MIDLKAHDSIIPNGFCVLRDDVEICDSGLQDCVWYKLGIARYVTLI